MTSREYRYHHDSKILDRLVQKWRKQIIEDESFVGILPYIDAREHEKHMSDFQNRVFNKIMSNENNN